MSALAKMSAPLNQGLFGTCVGHAFSKCLVDGVFGKYGVPLEIKDVLTAVKVACPCWEGHHLEPLSNEWNENVATKSQLSFPDVDNRCRYRVRVDVRRIDTVEEAYAEAKKIDGVLLLLVCISTETDGHGLHAVAVDKAYKQGDKSNEMRGLNSWGATKSFMDVTPDNFQNAVALDPIIFEKKEGSQAEEIPKVTRGYSEMSTMSASTGHSLPDLCQWWLNAGCRVTGESYPGTRTLESMRWWHDRSPQKVKHDMCLYGQHAAAGVEKYVILAYGPPVPAVSTFTYIQSQMDGGRYLDIIAGGRRLIIWDGHGGDNQKFSFQPRSNGFFSLYNPATGMVVEVQEDGETLGIADESDQRLDAQCFRLISDGRIVHVASRKCLDVSRRADSNGADVILWDKDTYNDANQRWTVKWTER